MLIFFKLILLFCFVQINLISCTIKDTNNHEPFPETNQQTNTINYTVKTHSDESFHEDTNNHEPFTETNQQTNTIISIVKTHSDESFDEEEVKTEVKDTKSNNSTSKTLSDVNSNNDSIYTVADLKSTARAEGLFNQHKTHLVSTIINNNIENTYNKWDYKQFWNRTKCKYLIIPLLMTVVILSIILISIKK